MLEKFLEESTLFVSKESVKDYSTLDTDVIFASPLPSFEVEGNGDNQNVSETCVVDEEMLYMFLLGGGINLVCSNRSGKGLFNVGNGCEFRFYLT